MSISSSSDSDHRDLSFFSGGSVIPLRALFSFFSLKISVYKTKYSELNLAFLKHK